MADQIVAMGEEIRPQIDVEGAARLAEKLYGIKVNTARELDGYDDKNYHFIVSQQPNNKYISQLWPHGYLLKIMNSSDSKKLGYIEAQCEMMLHFDIHGIKTPQPQRNINGKLYSIERLGNEEEPISGHENIKEHAVRLLSYHEGTLLRDVPWSYSLQFEVGKFTAQLDLILKSFYHPAYEKYSSLWCLKNAPCIKEYLFVVENEKRLSIVNEVIQCFEEQVLSIYDSLQSGMIHGDIHEQNLLCKKDGDGEWHISAVLDLGDSHFSAYVLELALATAYMMMWSGQIESASHVIAGYCTSNPLQIHELKLLKVCVCARLCQSLVLGLYTYSQHPTNEYVLTTQAAGWKLLESLWVMSTQKLEKLWFSGLQKAENI